MKRMNIDHFIIIAQRFREAIESIPNNERPIGLADFPKGACGDSVLLLGTFLIEQGEEPFDYMQGEIGENQLAQDWSSHAWLQRGNLIIDITADQFSDDNAKIIVTEKSAWHEALCGTTEQIANFRIYQQNTIVDLESFYGRLCNILSNQ